MIMEVLIKGLYTINGQKITYCVTEHKLCFNMSLKDKILPFIGGIKSSRSKRESEKE
jgi:hypothetical protein